MRKRERRPDHNAKAWALLRQTSGERDPETRARMRRAARKRLGIECAG